MSNQDTQRRKLKAAGYWFKRHGKKHEIWTNGIDTAILSYGTVQHTNILRRRLPPGLTPKVIK